MENKKLEIFIIHMSQIMLSEVVLCFLFCLIIETLFYLVYTHREKLNIVTTAI